MEVNDHPVEVILRKSQRFLVPLYQRKFRWDDTRLFPFWVDVATKATEVLEGESRFEHYMGALILAPVDSASMFAYTPMVQVVDGQQRLTTFHLFLAALREVDRTHGQNDLISPINSYLFNEPQAKDTDPLTKYKLTPTPSDRELFHDIIEMSAIDVDKKYKSMFWGKSIPKNNPQKAFRAYHLFRQWIEEFVIDGIHDFDEKTEESNTVDNHSDELSESHIMKKRIEALLNALLNRLKLVVIELGENDDAQVIFESLNSKSEPLWAMDLVRNNIFNRARKQKFDSDALYKRLWEPFDQPWWREFAPNARPKRHRLDHFLAHMLTAESGKKISIRELYSEYCSFFTPKGKPQFANVEDELKILEKFAPIYRTLEGVENIDPSLMLLGRKLAIWQVTTVYPVALQIGQDHVASEEREILAQLIYSYLVRRELCGLTDKTLNKTFQSIAAKFLSSGISVSNFKSFFTDKDGVSSRFPNDHQLKEGILNQSAYSISSGSRLRDILWELEVEVRPNLSEQVDRPLNLSIEHIMPQSWGIDWPFDNEYQGDNMDESDVYSRRNNLLHTIGNLTLLTSGLNTASGNKGFNEKKEIMEKNSNLFLNRWVVKKDKWAETEIQERGEWLYHHAVSRWPGLESKDIE